MWNLVELITSDIPVQLEFIKIFVWLCGWFLLFKLIAIPIEIIKSVIKGLVH
jgi:hypothetical protein